jgi:hypothetical protein
MPAQRRGIPIPHRGRFASVWLNPNVTLGSISRRYGVSEYTVNSWAKKLGLGPRPPREEGG